MTGGADAGAGMAGMAFGPAQGAVGGDTPGIGHPGDLDLGIGVRTFRVVETPDCIGLAFDRRGAGEGLPIGRQIGDIGLVITLLHRHTGEGAVNGHQLVFGGGKRGRGEEAEGGDGGELHVGSFQ